MSAQRNQKNQDEPIKETRGGYRANSGRPKGSVGSKEYPKKSKFQDDLILIPPTVSAALSVPPATHEIARLPVPGESPLQFLLRVMRDKRRDWPDRIRCAVVAAEYVHAKQPQAIHVTQNVRIASVTAIMTPGPWMPEPPRLPAGEQVENQSTSESSANPAGPQIDRTEAADERNSPESAP